MMDAPKNRLNDSEAKVLAQIDKVRQFGDKLKDEYVTMAHGAGGKASAQLVQQVFLNGYGNETLAALDDGAVIGLQEMLNQVGALPQEPKLQCLPILMWLTRLNFRAVQSAT
ncbi:hypothetical protein RQN30_06435 [Arcanobacterium hippocoleae]